MISAIHPLAAKFCNWCKIEKPIAFFNISCYARNKYDWLCRDCRAKYRRNYYLANREKEKERARNYKKDLDFIIKKEKINKKRLMKVLKYNIKYVRNWNYNIRLTIEHVKWDLEYYCQIECSKCKNRYWPSDFDEHFKSMVPASRRRFYYSAICNGCVYVEKSCEKRELQERKAYWMRICKEEKRKQKIRIRIKDREAVYNQYKNVKKILQEKIDERLF